MEDSQYNLSDFESLFQNQVTKPTCGIYDDKKLTECDAHKPDPLYTTKDVIASVKTALKAIQKADIVDRDKGSRKNLDRYKKSAFVSVNVLPSDLEEPEQVMKSTNKFETQCVTDTQLIDVIDKAEAILQIESDKGMTREFDTSFDETEKQFAELDKPEQCVTSKKQYENIISNQTEVIINLEIKKRTPDLSSQYLLDKEDNTALREVGKFHEGISNDNTEFISNNDEIDILNTQCFDKSMDIEKDLDDLGVVIEETDRPLSPVLTSNAKKPSQRLVFNLDDFENFEKLAVSLLKIEDDTNLNIEQEILHSQIIAIKHKLNSELENKDIEQPRSPILKTKCNSENNNVSNYAIPGGIEKGEDNKRNLNSNNTDVKPLTAHVIIKTEANVVKNYEIFKDEILFSSDEEDNYIHKNVNELPMTCALETSFYSNRSDILEKTMFVGFQTASNQSIQIRLDSFNEAKKVFDRLDKKDSETISLTDLVEKCDNSSYVKSINNTSNDVQNKEELVCVGDHSAAEKSVSMSNEIVSKNKQLYQNEILEQNYKNVKISEENEKYNKNKYIHLSDKVLEKVNNIFHDTDFNKDFDIQSIEIQNKTNEVKFDGSNSFQHQVNFGGFKNAGNQNIIMSENSLERSKTLIHDINKAHENDRVTEEDTEIVERMFIKPDFKGFTTASNKLIAISEKALENTKNIFNDVEIEDLFLDNFNEELSDVLDDAENKCEAVVALTGHNKNADSVIENRELVLFKTASNKKIDISKKALAQTKKIFDDECAKLTDSLSECGSPMFKGFQTASNKNIKISHTALAKSKKIFEEINTNNVDNLKNILPNVPVSDRQLEITHNNVLKSTKLYGVIKKYQTEDYSAPNMSSNNMMETFEDTLVKQKQVIENFGLSKSDLRERSITENTSFLGFQTASKKKVEVSKEALEKSKKIFQTIDNKSEEKSGNYKADEAIETYKVSDMNAGIDSSINIMNKRFTGFQTASNKQVEISEDAVTKIKNILKNEELIQTVDAPDTNMKFMGFHTASNKKIEISGEALAKMKNIFQDVDISESFKDPENNDKYVKLHTADKKVKILEYEAAKTKNLFQDKDSFQKTDPPDHIIMFKEFHTASNKIIEISEDALAKNNKIFQDVEISKNFNDAVNDAKFVGFHTASNKIIEISEDALAKTKKMFQDVDFSKMLNDPINKAKSVKFHTANNKKVEILENSHARITNIFQDNFIQKIDATDNNKKYMGFDTASNKKVEISEDALAKTKQMFQDIELSQNLNDTEDNAKFTGFHTANNKKIEISEDAIAKTKELFQDVKLSKTLNDPPTLSLGRKMVIISKDSLTKPNDTFDDIHIHRNHIDSKTQALKTQFPSNNIEVKNAKISIPEEIDEQNYINTQVLNNFEESLNTEDFLKSPKAVKRSVSPILSCPRAKKRKSFKTPYKLQTDRNTPKAESKTTQIHENAFKFNKSYKKTKLLQLQDVQLLETETENAVTTDPYISNFEFENLLDFEFTDKRNDVTDAKLTMDNLKDIFLNSVDKKIVPENWLDNHLKLIMWKLLSYELKFPKSMHNICNARTVIEQLKYRYDRELNNVERPALRKIFEKDDLSTRSLVLCVVNIFQEDLNVKSVTSLTKSIELLLTDGWYCIRACLDRMLSKLVLDGKIKVGTKIMTSGAELLNCEQGVSPWEDTSKVRLKMFGNSTRRAHWLARLGYHGSAAILSHLSTVKVDGGKVSKMRVFVSRVYPTLHVEKFDDGSTVTRSERLEQIYQMKYETDRQILMEKIYEEIEKEFSDQGSEDSELSVEVGTKRRSVESGSQLAKLMKMSRDPAHFQSELSASQSCRLQEYSSKRREKLLSDIEERVLARLATRPGAARMTIATVLKLRVNALRERDATVCCGMMTIWRPNEAILDLFEEGAWIDVTNILPTAIRHSEIQISAGRQSTYSRAKIKDTLKLSTCTNNLTRTCYTIKKLTENPNLNTDYNEIDTAGLIFLIDPPSIEFEKESIKQHHFQNVFLADADKNIICVNFWGGIKKFGYENVIDTGQIVSCANLQKRIGNTRKNIPQYRVTEFTIFTKTPKNRNSRSTIEELVKKFNGIDRRNFCLACIEKKNNSNVIKYQNNAENVSPYIFNNTGFNLSKNKFFIDSPFQTKQPAKKEFEDLNLTGLDFESTFKQKDTQDLSPEVLQRKQRVQDKIAKLKMYGEPPPLSPIYIINRSKQAANSFKSPIIDNNNTPKQNLNTASPKTITTKNSIIDDSEVKQNYQNSNVTRPSNEIIPHSDNIFSPLASMDRTYVKRKSVNPVKLNFSNNSGIDENNSNVDHFAEEIDSSPPLSLD